MFLRRKGSALLCRGCEHFVAVRPEAADARGVRRRLLDLRCVEYVLDFDRSQRDLARQIADSIPLKDPAEWRIGGDHDIELAALNVERIEQEACPDVVPIWEDLSQEFAKPALTEAPTSPDSSWG